MARDRSKQKSGRRVTRKANRLGLIEVALAKLKNEFLASANRVVEDSFPDTLYHYTKADAFISIVTSGKMRATHYAYLNDSEEYKGGLALIGETLRSLGEHEIEFRQLHDELVVSLERDASHPESPYVISFSEEGNLLSQWRAYADNGAGYSFGLEAFILAQVGSELRRCIYCNETFRKEVRKRYLAVQVEATRYVAKAQRMKQSEGALASDIAGSFALNMQALASAYKSQAFNEEQEWRIVVTKDADLGDTVGPFFRGSQRGVVPYMECDITSVDHRIPLTAFTLGRLKIPKSEWLQYDCSWKLAAFRMQRNWSFDPESHSAINADRTSFHLR
jgi:hypothetical protein